MDTILVVDDKPTNLNIISHVLRSEGYEVLEASSGPGAIEISNGQHQPIQLLVADMQFGYRVRNGRCDQDTGVPS